MDPLIPERAKTPEFTTGERCALVADILEQHPERHQQWVWFADDRWVEDPTGGMDSIEATVADVARTGDCGTVACVAGWAIAAGPVDIVEPWGVTGPAAEALGLQPDLASYVFGGMRERPELIRLLRWAATVPESHRTYGGWYEEQLFSEDLLA